MQLPQNHDKGEPEGVEAPPRLLSALRQLQQPLPFIPPTADEALLRQARRHLSPPERPGRRRLQMGWLRWAAAAALVVGLGIAVLQLFGPGRVATRQTIAASEDLNHDGRVDILDAFILARRITAGSPAGLSADVNGDGKTDDRDVIAIARHVVQLQRRTADTPVRSNKRGSS